MTHVSANPYRFKTCLVFYQVFAVRESIYGFSLPKELSEWLSMFEVLSFDVGSFIVPSWSCVGGLTTSLAFNGLAPLVLMAAMALALFAREAAHKRDFAGALLRSLQVAIFISFCALPTVTRSLFLAFQCESFGYDDQEDSKRSYLTASLNVECGSSEHSPIRALAAVLIVLWPVGMPLMYALLLYRCQRPILSHQPTTLTRAIRFLWSEYEDKYFWYELVELAKKLALTNFVLFIDLSSGSDKLIRLLVGLLVALLALTLQLQTQPFKKQSVLGSDLYEK